MTLSGTRLLSINFAALRRRARTRRLPRANPRSSPRFSPRAMPSQRAVLMMLLRSQRSFCSCVNMSHSSFVKCDCLARSERPDLLGGEPRAFGDDPERHPAFEQGFRRAAEARTYAQFAPFFAAQFAESDAFPARRVDDAVAVPAFLLFLCEHEPFLLREM